MERTPTEPSTQHDSVDAVGHTESRRNQPPNGKYRGSREDQRPFNGTSRKPNQSKTCYHCGGLWPHSDQQPCPAHGKTCTTCRKLNHFAAVCRSGRPVSTHPRRPERFSHVNVLHDDSSSSDEEYLYTVTQEPEQRLNGVGQTKSTACNKPELKVKIGSVHVPVLIDTGASVNVLNKDHYSQITRQQTNITLQKSKIQLYAYGNKASLPVLGKFDTTIEVCNTSSPATFYVIDGNHGSLLNCATATALGLLKINVAVNSISPEHAATQPTFVTKLVEEYADIFQGIGKLKSEGVQIHIDPEAKPTVQPHRRIPFHIRRKVECELDALEKAGIIETPTGPTP